MFLTGLWNFEAELSETLGFKYGKTLDIFISTLFKKQLKFPQSRAKNIGKIAQVKKKLTEILTEF